MNLVNIISSRILESKLLAKFRRMGKNDIQETPTASPYGVDSNPVAGMVAVYSETGEKGKNILLGYLNKNAIAGVGELRLFSTDSAGIEQTYQWFKNDGTIELNGSNDNLVRFSELQVSFNKLQSDLNDLASIFNTHVHFSATPGAPTSTPTSVAGTSTVTIDAAKIDEIKTSAG